VSDAFPESAESIEDRLPQTSCPQLLRPIVAEIGWNRQFRVDLDLAPPASLGLWLAHMMRGFRPERVLGHGFLQALEQRIKVGRRLAALQ
jgi:hypothetical protein